MIIPNLSEVSSFVNLLSNQSPQKLLHKTESLVTTNTIPGGTPLRLCQESQDTDLFKISSITLEKQPVFIDDEFTLHIDGEFRETFHPNSTIDITANCGSWCDAYNVTDPNDRQGETDREKFCAINYIEQPIGHVEQDCPPQPGPAMITAPGWVMPMIIWWPGYYNFTFDAKTLDGRRIYCLTAEVCMRWEDEDKNRRLAGDRPWGDCTWPN